MLKAKSIGKLALFALVFAFLGSIGAAGTFLTFGPVSYVRSSAKPAPETRAFPVLDPAAAYTLRIDAVKVSAAIITLNGVDIFTEKDFNANVTVLTKAVSLRPTNQLTVELRGKPDESLTVQVIGLDTVVPTITPK